MLHLQVFLPLISHASREYKTIQPDLSSKNQKDNMSHRFSNNYTGFRFKYALTTNLQHLLFDTLMVCNERHSFHARVGRFSPFLYLRSVAIAVILFWLKLVVLVSPCFLGSRISRDYRFPPAPPFLCSERKPSSLTTGSSKL